MGASTVVSLTYQADIRDLKAKLASIPGITEAEARKSVAALEKQLKSLSKAGEQTKAKAKGAAEGLKAIGDAGDRAGRDAQKLAGILGSISPDLGNLARGVNDAGDALDVLGSSGAALAGPIGILGAAVAALGAAFVAVQGDIDRARASTEAIREVYRTTLPTARALEDAQIKLAAATGQITEAEAEHKAASLSAQRAVLDYASAQREQRAALDESIVSAEKWLSVTRGAFALLPESTQAYTDQINVVRRAADAVFGWSSTIEQGRRNIEALNSAVAIEAENQAAFVDVTMALSDATRSETDAREIRRSVVERDLALQAEEAERLERLRVARAELWAMAEPQMKSQTERADAIIARRDAELDRIDELVAATGALEAADAARAATQIETEQELADLRAELVEDLQARQQRADEEALRAIERRRDAYREAASIIAGSLGEVADALEGAEGASASQREAAFRVAKAIAYAEAVINTAQGVTAALTLPPPLGFAAAATVAAAGAAQVATIAATEPSYHQGGMVRDMAPDEVRGPRMTSDEAVLTSRGVRAVGGPQGVSEANRGRPGASQAAPMVVGVIAPPGSPTRLLREAVRSRDGAATIVTTARSSPLRVRR
jgi:hypothetical protein